MQDTEELVTLLRVMPPETVSALREVVETLAAVQDDSPRCDALVRRMEELTASRNVTAESMRAMLADWRAEWAQNEAHSVTYEDARRRVQAEPE
jgi:hypothetical protein